MRKFLNSALSLILVICLVFSLCGCLSKVGSADIYSFFGSDAQYTRSGKYADYVVDTSRYVRTTLEPAEKALYDEIVRCAAFFDKEIYTDITDVDTIFHVILCVYADYPEFFWLDSGSYLESTVDTNTVEASKITINFSLTEKTAEEELPKVEAAAERCLRLISDDMSDYQKVKIIYDYLVVHVEYDIETLEDQSLYGALVNGKAVCSGYAKAMQYLLNKVGIPATYAWGDAVDMGSHAWVYAKIDGKYYIFDPTWGDLGEESSYSYFAMTSEQSGREHRVSGDFPLPVCVAKDASYFNVNGTLIDEYNENTLYDTISSAVDKGVKTLQIRFTEKSAFNKAKRFIKGDGFKDAMKKIKEETPSFSTVRLNYFLDEAQYTAIFFLVY